MAALASGDSVAARRIGQQRRCDQSRAKVHQRGGLPGHQHQRLAQRGIGCAGRRSVHGEHSDGFARSVAQRASRVGSDERARDRESGIAESRIQAHVGDLERLRRAGAMGEERVILSAAGAAKGCVSVHQWAGCPATASEAKGAPQARAAMRAMSW